MIYLDNFFTQLFGILKRGKFTDFIIYVGGTKIRVHKIVLASSSECFAAMLSPEMNKPTNRLEINEFPISIIKALIEYIYTGSAKHITTTCQPPNATERDVDYLMNLLIVADMYQIDGLKTVCEENLCNAVRNFSTDRMMVFAIRHNLRELRFEVAKQMVRQHPSSRPLSGSRTLIEPLLD